MKRALIHREVQRGAMGAIATVLLLCGSGAWAEDAKPKRRDSRIIPPEVTYKARVEPAKAKPGETVLYQVVVSVDSPWHIYAWAEKQPDEGPRSTQFDFFDHADLIPGKAWTPDRPPLRKKEPAFPDLAMVEFYERQVIWSIPIKIPDDAAPGDRVLKSQIYFQICDENACKPPTYATVPEAVLTVSNDHDVETAVLDAKTVGLSALLLMGLVQDARISEAAAAAAPEKKKKVSRPQ